MHHGSYIPYKETSTESNVAKNKYENSCARKPVQSIKSVGGGGRGAGGM